MKVIETLNVTGKGFVVMGERAEIDFHVHDDVIVEGYENIIFNVAGIGYLSHQRLAEVILSPNTLAFYCIKEGHNIIKKEIEG